MNAQPPGRPVKTDAADPGTRTGAEPAARVADPAPGTATTSSPVRWALTALLSGLAGSAAAALPPAAPADGAHELPARGLLDARVHAVRQALALQQAQAAADAAPSGGAQADQTAPWANWSNWSNWPKWSKWSNWANA